MKFLLAALLFLDCSAFAQSALCREGDTAYTPVIEMVKGNKRVLIVGFVRVAPKDYFEREKSTMKNWLAEDNSKATILTESYTCRGSVLQIKEGAYVNGALLNQLYAKAHGDKNDVKQILFDNAVERECSVDADGNSRPDYIVKANQYSRMAVAKEGLAMQWDMLYPHGPNVKVRSGDFDLNKLPATGQILASLDAVPVAREETEAQNFAVFTQKFTIEGRSGHVVNQALDELKTSDRVILPWGAGHAPSLQQLLEAQGYKVVKRSGVKVAATSDHGLPIDYKLPLQAHLDAASPMAGNCAPAQSLRIRPSAPPADSTTTK